MNRRFGFLTGTDGGNDKAPENKQEDKTKGHKQKQFQGKQQNSKPQDQNTKPSKESQPVDGQKVVRDSVKSLFKDINSSSIRLDSMQVLDIKTSKKVIKARGSLSVLRAASKKLEDNKRDADRSKAEIDLDKMTLQEIILSPMERFKAKVDPS